MGYVLLCSKEKQHVNSALFEPWLCLWARRSKESASLPGQWAIQAWNVVHEWKHSLPFSSHASLKPWSADLVLSPLTQTRERGCLRSHSPLL